jgi:hypothetical protein
MPRRGYKWSKSVKMYGALGKNNNHIANTPAMAIILLDLLNAQNKAAKPMGIAAKNKFQSRKPKISESVT